MIKVDNVGNIEWQKSFQDMQITDVEGADIIELHDSTIIVTGSYTSHINQQWTFYFNKTIRLEADGDTLWQK